MIEEMISDTRSLIALIIIGVVGLIVFGVLSKFTPLAKMFRNALVIFLILIISIPSVWVWKIIRN